MFIGWGIISINDYPSTFTSSLTLFQHCLACAGLFYRILLQGEGEKLAVNFVEGSDHLLCQSIRIRSLDLLLTCLSRQPSNQTSIVKTFLATFPSLELEASKGRLRHFENSEIHKLTNRLMQATLVLVRSHSIKNNQAVMQNIVL